MSTANPNRMSVSETLRMMLAKGHGNQDSVTLTRNAKGETQIEVVARSREDETLADVTARARVAYDGLRALYPFLSASGGNGAA